MGDCRYPGPRACSYKSSIYLFYEIGANYPATSFPRVSCLFCEGCGLLHGRGGLTSFLWFGGLRCVLLRSAKSDRECSPGNNNLRGGRLPVCWMRLRRIAFERMRRRRKLRRGSDG